MKKICYVILTLALAVVMMLSSFVIAAENITDKNAGNNADVVTDDAIIGEGGDNGLMGNTNGVTDDTDIGNGETAGYAGEAIEGAESAIDDVTGMADETADSNEGGASLGGILTALIIAAALIVIVVMLVPKKRSN